MTGSQNEKRERTTPLQKASLISEEEQNEEVGQFSLILRQKATVDLAFLCCNLCSGKKPIACLLLAALLKEGLGVPRRGLAHGNSPCACECVRDCITYAGGTKLEKYAGWSRVC